MKKLQLFVLVFPILSFAQLTTPQGQVQSTVNPVTGFVGIGTTNPQSKLEIYGGGDLSLKGATDDAGDLIFQQNTGKQNGRIWSNENGGLFFSGSDNNPKVTIIDNGNVGIGTSYPENIEGWSKVMEIKSSTDVKLIASTSDITTGIWAHNYGFFSSPPGGIAGTTTNHPYSLITNKIARMTVAPSGNIGIGTTNPQNKLDVNGAVHAKEVKVDMAGWADFVFHKDYELPTLDEVEKHIQEKGHLPNIPSTKEITENGLSLGESQKLLLQKIEELTLYSIEQNKLIRLQQKRLKKLEEKQNIKP
ncbi:hypothetical protein [Elizabethkingia meningoseptica]|uniref:hypothetical protein n=1 Tax=Elizabethkingia meningoseptica TaxID=238 RepID=UPI002011AB13|nr:hypothetical protein [Elizabethkingia meningoseptica]MCL1676976.1 hypothetical protein [Elizabethkingia meningoseptica]MCL1685119.1 hypothetical protein [Elizabethkingia meningoseptica]